jgi:hypothetical protein
MGFVYVGWIRYQCGCAYGGIVGLAVYNKSPIPNINEGYTLHSLTTSTQSNSLQLPAFKLDVGFAITKIIT